MNMFKLTAVAAALFLAAFNPAAAQWQAPNHSVPVGQGAGVTGFKSAAPGATGLPLTSNGATSDPSFQAIGNAAFGTTVPANTYKCNPTSSPGALQDCTNSSAIVYYICNGTADSTPMAVALALATAVGGAGGTLHISGSSCIQSAALTPTTNVSIEGDGMNQTFLKPAANSTNCINFNPNGGVATASPYTVNIRRLTCTYPTLTSGGAVGFQYGNLINNNGSGVIDEVGCTNCTSGINLTNAINTTVVHSDIGPFYNYGIQINSPLSADAGNTTLHDNYIQDFAPVTSGAVGIMWISGGAFNAHDNTVFAPRPIYLHQSAQTTEVHVHHNLNTGTGSTPTAGIQVDTISASFTCSSSGSNLTVSAVTGSLLPALPPFPASPTSSGQTVLCNGTALGTLVSQTSGTTGGAGVYVTTGTGTTSGSGVATFQMFELLIDGNIQDSTVRPLYVPANAGGLWLYNLTYSNNLDSSDFNSSTNQVTVFDTMGFVMNGNIIRCNGTCTAGRPILIDSSTDHVGIFQPRSMEPGSWGVVDTISSTNTCGMSTNALLTGC